MKYSLQDVDDEPGTSSRKTPQRIVCLTTGCNSTASVNLGCQHKFCYECFVIGLQQNQTPMVNRCQNCNAKISDEDVERNLETNDYASYVQHTFITLRTALAKIDRNYAAEFIDYLPNEVHDKSKKDTTVLQILSCPFDCPNRTDEIAVDHGVVLKNCWPDGRQFIFPFNNEAGTYEFSIQNCEIHALASTGEVNLENVVHCKTPDIEAGGDIGEVCQRVNCVKCSAVHDEKTCEEYQNDIKNDTKNMKELKLSEEAIAKLIADGQIMLCPKCDTLIEKINGCDFVECLSCKLGLCYRTKKPRQPFKKMVSGVEITIDGCHCRENNGLKCHPNCVNCH